MDINAPQQLLYTPYATTELFHDDNSNVRGILGPIGSSKSSACACELRFRALDQAPDANGWRRTSWVIVRKSYPALISTTIKTWNEWMPQAKVNMSPPFRWHWKQENVGVDENGKPDGTHIDMEVNFMSISDPRQDVNKIRSLNITGVWINEAQELEDVSLVKYLYSRCGRFPGSQVAPLTWSGLIMDANAMDLDHWWYQYAEVIKPQGWKFFRQPPAVLKITDDAEMKKLRAQTKKRIIDQKTHIWKINDRCENVDGQPKHENYWLDQIEGNHESWIAINLEAKYGQSMEGRPVFLEFDETRHVAKEEFEPIPGLTLQLGFDFGLTPSCVICQITPQGQLRVIDEVCGESMGMRQFMRDALKPILSAQYPGYGLKGIGEPAGNQRAQSDESTAMDEIRAAGIECIPAPTNFFGPRRDAVASFMLKRVRSTITGKATEEGFIVSPRCKMLLKGWRGDYKFKRVKVDGKDVYEAEAVKNECSHCLAAGTLIDTNRGKLFIEDVTDNDLVKTPMGYQRVLFSGPTKRNAEVLMLMLDNGSRLVATPDHLIATKQGWKRLDALQYTDVLYGIYKQKGDASCENIGYKSSWEENIITGKMDILPSGQERNIMSIICTGTFGPLATDRFPRVMISITKTVIRVIMKYQIWKEFCDSRITALMPSRITNLIQKAWLKVRRQLYWPQKNGTELPKDLSGIANTERKHGKIEQLNPELVFTVGNNTIALLAQQRKVSVQCDVKPLPGTLAASTSSSVPVPFADNFSERINMDESLLAVKIVGLKKYPVQKEVYDLTVELAHCFFANGVLVHNCQDAVQAIAVTYDRPKIDADARNRMGKRDDGSNFTIGFATDYPSI